MVKKKKKGGSDDILDSIAQAQKEARDIAAASLPQTSLIAVRQRHEWLRHLRPGVAAKEAWKKKDLKLAKTVADEDALLGEGFSEEIEGDYGLSRTMSVPAIGTGGRRSSLDDSIRRLTVSQLRPTAQTRMVMMDARLRGETHFDAAVEVVCDSMDRERQSDIFFLPALPSEHRHEESSVWDEEKVKRRVMRVLKRHSVCDIYDLARMSCEEWCEISRDLDGLHLPEVKKNVLEFVQHKSKPVDRATFWASVARRQRPVDHGRTLQFPTGYR